MQFLISRLVDNKILITLFDNIAADYSFRD